MYRIGIDVGGTNTDACILDITASSNADRGFVTSCKTPTTPDVTTGIKTAVEKVLRHSCIPLTRILNTAVGTTHFINAVVEADAQKLDRVAVVRLCGPYTKKNPPFADFPPRLKSIVAGPIFYLRGGLEIDGREICALDPAEIEKTVAAIGAAGIKRVALVGVFSALDHDGRHEERCRKIMLDHNPDLEVTCSHTVGGPGLLARENATILNAAILRLALRAIVSYRRAMLELGLTCPLYLTQNDGTLTDALTAASLPIRTFASGATNSMMGAAFLQGLDTAGVGGDRQVLVVDIGGTTTDVGALMPSGFPRQAPNFVEVGGVRTAFSMPDVLSVGLGGGSRVKTEQNQVRVGPDSVGHRLLSEALVFGGTTLTATDIAVAAGVASIGDSGHVGRLPSQTITDARHAIKARLERLIEDMKVSVAPVTVLLVGGGSVIVTDPLEGVAECVSPPHHDSANAVGAAIAKVAGEIDVIELMEGRDEQSIVEAAKEKAMATAVRRGADKNDVAVVELDKIPLQYVTSKATRLVVRAVGSLSVSAQATPEASQQVELNGTDDAWEADCVCDKPVSVPMHPQEEVVNISEYQPNVTDGVWDLSHTDVDFIACGCGILGTGGGGSSYDAALHAHDILRNGGTGKMRVISPSSLGDDDLCMFGAGYGAPSVSNERIDSGQEIFAAIDGLCRVLGHKDFVAVISDEIGGGNGLATFPSSVHYDRPIVDADVMGRAYPTMEHSTCCVHGEAITPCAMADAKGNLFLVMGAESNTKVERMLRTTCMELGNSAAVASTPLRGKAIKQLAVPHTVSQAWWLGRAIHLARQLKVNPVKAISDTTTARHLYSGKIVDVTRNVSGGYTKGRCLIAPNPVEDSSTVSDQAATESRHLLVPFQNEYLYAAYVDYPSQTETEEVVCCVPDLISILGEDGEAIGSPELRYGLRVHVIAMPAHPLWTGSEKGLKVGGPEYFGLNMKWRNVMGDYHPPDSVIDRFDKSRKA